MHLFINCEFIENGYMLLVLVYYSMLILPEEEEVLYYQNLDLGMVTTPIDTDELECLLTESEYDRVKTQFLVDGFRNGFSIGYEGDEYVKLSAPNLPLTVGTETDLWNKVMKEVKAKRYKGPFEKIPFEYYIQSPIGLVPKDGGKDTRLIFHLSYPRESATKAGTSVNANTPHDRCRVKYKDFDMAIRRCLKREKIVKLAKQT